MKPWMILLALLVVFALFAANGGSGRRAQEACVDVIATLDDASGVHTDYRAAYRTCRAAR